MIKYCPKCYENHIKKMGCYNGYYYCLKDDVETCWIDGCNHKLVNIDFPALDLKILTEISDDPQLYKSMIDLHDKDIIEYELKMSQFRTQVQQQKQVESAQQESNVPHCPHCNSTNIRPITTGSRLLSTTLFGFASRKIGKSYECLNCKYTW